jgi:hypothetical protein
MKTWIENLNNPLVLVAFVVFILAGVISLFIKRAKASQKLVIKGDKNIGIAAGGSVTLSTNKPQKKK